MKWEIPVPDSNTIDKRWYAYHFKPKFTWKRITALIRFKYHMDKNWSSDPYAYHFKPKFSWKRITWLFKFIMFSCMRLSNQMLQMVSKCCWLFCLISNVSSHYNNWIQAIWLKWNIPMHGSRVWLVIWFFNCFSGEQWICYKESHFLSFDTCWISIKHR